MKKTLSRAALALVPTLLIGCSSGGPKSGVQTKLEQDSVVTVTALDVPNRLVTVRDASGDTTTFYVDESNKAFPQAQVGDQVRVRFTESVAYKLVAPGSAPGMKVEETTSRPQDGRAAGQSRSQVTATVRIESVQQRGSVVTFTGPRGRRTVQISDPALKEYAAKLRPGDNVEVTYSEAVAVSLERISK
jgi:hypothetical protein